eukprot:ANDGO_03333.mRNA.1 Cleavage stimulation factor subunit 50
MSTRSAYLYQLIIAQLLADGYVGAAQQVSAATMVTPDPSVPTGFLSSLVQEGLSVHRERSALEQAQRGNGSALHSSGVTSVEEVLDESSSVGLSLPASSFSTWYLTTHQGEINTCAFSADGRLCATGSSDQSIKLIDVEKVRTYDRGDSSSKDKHPVIATWKDLERGKPINEVVFHPREQLLFSASDDSSVLVFDCSRSASSRRGKLRSYQTNTTSVKTLDIHPSGDFLLAGSDSDLVLIDIASSQQVRYQATKGVGHAYPGIGCVRYSPTAELFATAGRDGVVKLWGTVSGELAFEMPRIHGGFEVNSVCWSKSGRFLLTSGRDGVARLFDIRSLLTSSGNPAPVREFNLSNIQSSNSSRNFVAKHPCVATMSFNEQLVFSTDERTNSIVVWNVRTSEKVFVLSGHTANIRWIAASPTEMAFFSCSHDCRGRFWGLPQP